jgi:hypothetical protein
MQPLDRYLDDVRRHLPRKNRDDVIEELRDALLSLLERRAAEGGRPLTAEEEAKTLRAFGHPYAVAARYWTGRGLIGGPFTPYYRVTLLCSFIAICAVHVSLGVVSVFGGAAMGDAFVSIIPDIVLGTLLAFAIVTLVFLMLDLGRSHARTKGGAAS